MNHLHDGRRSIDRKSLSSNDITTAKTCSDSQSIGKGKIVNGYLL